MPGGKRTALALAFALVGIATRVSAQGSPYVPLDDISYTYVDALQARGELRELPVLERPYTEGVLRAAIDSARAKGPGAVVASYLDGLGRSIAKYAVRPHSKEASGRPPFRARFTNDFYVTGQTSGRRELMRADGRSSVRPATTIRLVMAGGPVAAAIRPIIDTRLNADPEFTGRQDRTLAGRTEDGYVSAQWKYVELFFGRLGRNWGPPSQYGLQLGNYAYTYDHAYARFGTRNYGLSTVVTRLDDYKEESGAIHQRYFSIHRLALRRGIFEVALSESFLYTGVNRGFEPSLVNPFNIYALSWRDENQNGNFGLGFEASVRPRNLGIFSGHVYIDDLQIDRDCGLNCDEPSSYGVTVSAEGLPLRGAQKWYTSYTRVSNLTYRTPTPAETYAVFNVGLGRGFSDYDELRVGTDLALVPATPLKLYVAHRRQGEGDYRRPIPTADQYAVTRPILSGIVRHVTRVGLSGASRLSVFELGGDVGVNHTTNFARVVGDARTRFEGRVRVAIEPRWSLSF